MATSPTHKGLDIPSDEMKSVEIAPTPHVIRTGDCPSAAVSEPPFLQMQPSLSIEPNWRRDSGLCLSGGPLPARLFPGMLSRLCAASAGTARQRACLPDPALRESASPGLLDFVVDYANRCSVFGVRYKPYWIMCDIATLSTLALACAFSSHFPEVSALGLGLGILGALLAHKVVLEAKAALGFTAARSFLQDGLLIIVPTFIAISVICGQPVELTFAFVGLLLPLYGCFARIGCFLGGCCYGKPHRYGVLYPGWIFLSPDNGCRRYSPSPDPQGRVLPIQLVEAVAQLSLFVILAFLVRSEPHSARYIFPFYLLLYAIVRIALDCYRTTSARPRYGRFSEAQLVSAFVAVVSSIAIAYMATA
jgi:phosphatidylglycerol:prolipoprotein diacylglycerol transferase